jgi:hypothetical protein
LVEDNLDERHLVNYLVENNLVKRHLVNYLAEKQNWPIDIWSAFWSKKKFGRKTFGQLFG